LSISTTIEARAPARRLQWRGLGGFLAASALVLAVWTLSAATIAAARPGEAMVVALGDPAQLLRNVDPDRIRLVQVAGGFVLAAVSGREGVRALYENGALLVLPGRRGGCGLPPR
jgi:hypothetical protein